MNLKDLIVYDSQVKCIQSELIYQVCKLLVWHTVSIELTHVGLCINVIFTVIFPIIFQIMLARIATLFLQIV